MLSFTYLLCLLVVHDDSLIGELGELLIHEFEPGGKGFLLGQIQDLPHFHGHAPDVVICRKPVPVPHVQNNAVLHLRVCHITASKERKSYLHKEYKKNTGNWSGKK